MHPAATSSLTDLRSGESPAGSRQKVELCLMRIADLQLRNSFISQIGDPSALHCDTTFNRTERSPCHVAPTNDISTDLRQALLAFGGGQGGHVCLAAVSFDDQWMHEGYGTDGMSRG
mmetsp:Transcript_20437/g.45577  ORF Transcript_20437/g.45577 Transcript_20437/m.45577 type:complete len:117 (+) Transcript_20437:1066-1416(+)